MAEGSKPPNYMPGNTKRDREKQDAPAEPEKRQLKKVIAGTAVTKKKGVGRRFKEVFFEDNADRIGEYLIMDVIIPGSKDLLMNLGSTFLERILFGEVRPRIANGRPTGILGTLGRNNYQPAGRPQTPRSTSTAIQLSDQARRSHDFGDIIIPDRGSADLVLMEMQQQILEYKVCTVAELLNLVGVTESFVDNEWGWYSLEGAHAKRVANGYRLILPPTEQLTR